MAVTLDDIATRYVTLVRDLGAHSDGYIDAQYGPAKDIPASAQTPPLSAIVEEATALQRAANAVTPPKDDAVSSLRRTFLIKQLTAVAAYARFLSGGPDGSLSFDAEAGQLYDAAPPTQSTAHFQAILDEIDALLPGSGTLLERYTAFKRQFIIPPEKLDAVFVAAIEETRRRTKQHINLPESESFVVRYVKDKPWSGYNWYMGDYHSVIEVNVDLPVYIDRAVDLAAHEGYPGHHVFNVLLERDLVRGRGFVEFSIYPLFTPQSLIAEGTANYGIQMVFPDTSERCRFEASVLFPLAGLDADLADTYYRIEDKVQALSYVGNEVTRGLLNGTLTDEQAVHMLSTYALMAPERAAQRLRFIKTYRSYVINYNVGQDLVKGYVAAVAPDERARWETFERLLATPQVPSGLRVDAAASSL